MTKRRRWQQLLNDALAGVYPALEAMTDAELRRVRGAPQRVTQTNCWWLAFQAAPLLASIAGDILKSRRFRARRAKAQERIA